MIATLAALAVAAIIGFPFVRAIDRTSNRLFAIGCSLLVGCGVIALDLFALSALDLAWLRGSVAVSLALVVSVALVVSSRKARATPPSSEKLPYTPGAAIFDLATLLTILGHAVYATWTPQREWDYFGIWGLKARTFFEVSGIDWHFLHTNISHPDYPLLVPFLLDYLAIARGAWDERWSGLLFTALCASVILVARGLLAEELRSHRWAAAGALVMACPTLNVWIGLGEAAVMAYGCAGILSIRHGMKTGRPQLIRLGAILIGFSAWSKNEGLALIAITCAVTFLVAPRDSWRMMIESLWPALAIPSIWLVTRALLTLPTDFLTGPVLGRVIAHLRDFRTVAGAFLRYPPDQPWLWLALIISILICWREAITTERFLTLVAGLQLAVLAGQSLATPWDIRAHIQLSWNRLPHQIAPALVFLAIVLLMPRLGGAASRRLPPGEPGTVMTPSS